MTWNYRLINKNGVIGVHEVYYLETGKIWACTKDAVSLRWDEDEDGAWYADKLQEAFIKPILNYEDIENE